MPFYKIILLLIDTFFLSCKPDKNQTAKDNSENLDKSIAKQEVNLKSEFWHKNFELKESISQNLSVCVPKNWSIIEVFDEDSKTYLAHIGKGEFDLHIKANYTVKDTLLEEHYNGKDGAMYYPEIILHFYKKDEKVRQAVKFTHENAEIISDFKFALPFGETEKYLIYECASEKQMFQPIDQNVLPLRECLIKSLNN